MIDFENSPKKGHQSTLNAKARELAREMGMNVSQVVDALPQEGVRRRYREKWLAENQEAIAEYPSVTFNRNGRSRSPEYAVRIGGNVLRLLPSLLPLLKGNYPFFFQRATGPRPWHSTTCELCCVLETLRTMNLK